MRAFASGGIFLFGPGNRSVIRSMTGFGRGEAVSSGYRFAAEIKSVNHRFLNLSIRLPRAFAHLESRLAARCSSRCERGHLHVSVELEREGAVGAGSLEELVSKLDGPRAVWLMVPAALTGRVLDEVTALMKPGDIVIDGGNSFYQTTERRDAYLASKGLRFIGAGVSGGEEGARKGPSIMPGGPPSTWEVMKPIFESIAAKVDGEPCVIHIGPGGDQFTHDLHFFEPEHQRRPAAKFARTVYICSGLNEHSNNTRIACFGRMHERSFAIRVVAAQIYICSD